MPMCLGADAPALWYTLPEAERASRALLSSDQCVIDNEHFFVRGRILLPIVESDDSFIWLAWVSLSAKNFKRMSELWDTDGREAEHPYFGWLQSALPYAESTLSLKTAVHTMPLGERPEIEIKSEEHQLATEQIRGISMARVQEIVERALHG
ncbi:hypothetical protein SAMN05428948_2796 [Massilia sp. CF038]|nr:hypothetical protein SAMN05428948_2796 [Massilia sp. CF038]